MSQKLFDSIYSSSSPAFEIPNPRPVRSSEELNSASYYWVGLVASEELLKGIARTIQPQPGRLIMRESREPRRTGSPSALQMCSLERCLLRNADTLTGLLYGYRRILCAMRLRQTTHLHYFDSRQPSLQKGRRPASVLNFGDTVVSTC